MKKFKRGYTSGVFDLFHVGHLNIIKRAKEHCDYLIVGVSTDELVMSYKNKKPVVSFAERVEVVSAIKYVDEVVPQECLSKVDAWDRYQYNALFGGSDWANNKAVIVAEKELRPKGVEIVLFPYTETTSSTMLTKALSLLMADI